MKIIPSAINKKRHYYIGATQLNRLRLILLSLWIYRLTLPVLLSQDDLSAIYYGA